MSGDTPKIVGCQHEVRVHPREGGKSFIRPCGDINSCNYTVRRYDALRGIQKLCYKHAQALSRRGFILVKVT